MKNVLLRLALGSLSGLILPGIVAAQTVSTGTGFFVTDSGVAVTNAHVVDGCAEITVTMRDSEDRRATRIAEDKGNDLALIRIQNAQITSPLTLNFRPQWGGVAHVFGFPLSDRLSPNFTTGTVTSLSIKNNSSILQISAQVQPGNSGGPILDDHGTVIGVVVAKLNSMIAENVNFGIRSQAVDAFLHSEGISLPLPVAQSGPKLDGPKIAELAKTSSIKIYCKKIEDPNIVKVSCKMQDGPLKDRVLGIAINLSSKTATVETINPASNDRVRLKVVDARETKIRLASEKWLLGSSKVFLPVLDIYLNTMLVKASVWNQSVPSEPALEDVVCDDKNKSPLCWGDVSRLPDSKDSKDLKDLSVKIETANGICRRVP